MQRTEEKYGKKGTRYLTEFESYSEYMDLAGQEDPRGGAGWRKGGGSWAGTACMADAMKLAREGWPEGVEMMKGIAASMSVLTSGLVMKPEIAWDVTGDFADAGLFSTGVPECMGSFTEVIAESRGKVVSMLLNISASSGVETETMMRRGAAALALVDALEESGRSCEIYVGEAVSDHGDSQYMFSVPIKRAGEPAELDRLAFALAHPSMLRRLAFSIEEHESDKIRNRFQFVQGGNFGMPDEIENIGERFNLIVPELSMLKWDCDADMLAWVKKSLVEQGCEVEGMETANVKL